MKNIADLFETPNAAQQSLMTVIDGLIAQGKDKQQVLKEMQEIFQDEQDAVTYFCIAYIESRFPEIIDTTVSEFGYTLCVGVDSSQAELPVDGVVSSITPEEGLYIHIDLILPDVLNDRLDVDIFLEKGDYLRSFKLDRNIIPLFADGKRVHLEPLPLKDIVEKSSIAKDGTPDTLRICLCVNWKEDIILHIPIIPSGDSVGKVQSPAKKELPGQDRLAVLEGYPSLAAFRAHAANVISHCRVAGARKESGLVPNPPVLHTALIGNPGTGKGRCARILAGIYKDFGYLVSDEVHTTRVSKLISSMRSEAYSNTISAIEGAMGATLLFEYAHELGKTEGPNAEGEKAIVQALIDALADTKKYPRWMLVLSGDPDGMESLFASFPELRQYLADPVYFSDCTPAELNRDIDPCCQRRGLRLTDDARKKLETYLLYLYNHRGPGFDNARMVSRIFDNRIIPAMYRRLGRDGNPADGELDLVEGVDIPTVVANPDADMSELDGLVGLGKIKARVKDYLYAVRLAGRRMEMGLPTSTPRLHMAFLGNPGTGKTTVAEIIGRVFASWGILSGGRVIRTEKSQMVGQYIGETEFKMTRLLSRARGNILFIDEAYQLVEGGEKDYGRIVMNSLLTELGKENPDMVVILAGYTAPMKRLLESNEGVESRFPNVFNFEDYTTNELLEIGKQMISRQGFTLTAGAEANMRKIIEEESEKPSPRFGNGRFVSNLIQNDILASLGARTAAMPNPTKEDLSTILPQDVIIGKARKNVVFDDIAIDAALARLDALSGIHHVKEAIHQFVRSARYLHSIGEPYVGKGLLAWRFIGPSGTGKSTVAEIMASILKGMRLIANSHITQIKGERIFNVSESDCDQVLREAVMKACNGLIFIDVDDPKFADTRSNYGRSVEQIRLKVKELTVEVGGECALVLAELDAPNKDVAEQLSEGGVYEFDHSLIFKEFTPDELFEVLCHCLEKFDVAFTPAAEKHMREYLNELKGSVEANARTMKLMARTIYQQVILRESGLTRPPKVHQVQLADVSTFRWDKKKGKIGF